MVGKPTLAIEYCTVCKFGGRAAWLAQEVLSAYEADLAAVTLVPGRGGMFEVRIDDELVFSRRDYDRFPEPREIKDAVRAALGLEPAPRHD